MYAEHDGGIKKLKILSFSYLKYVTFYGFTDQFYMTNRGMFSI